MYLACSLLNWFKVRSLAMGANEALSAPYIYIFFKDLVIWSYLKEEDEVVGFIQLI
jgi:hypothetical protein